MDLFRGFEGQHGTHGTPDLDPNGLKWGIKRTAKTLREPVTLAVWEKHLSGARPLGVIPIMKDSTCVWGSIDIDDYDIDLMEVVQKIEKLKLPLVPCRSKSGGLHLFIFMSEPVEAERVQSALRDIAASIGFAGSEIFPKQTRILVDQGDQGNWIVMPYFGSDYDGKLKMQYGLKKTGAEMTLEEFVSRAEKLRVTPDQLSLIRVKKPKKERPPFSDGPPCLQHLAEGGFPEGGRNNALFQIGVYLKKAFPSDWQTKLEQDNQQYMRPPLASEEVSSVIRSLEKKEYEYKCKDQPMVSHCDSMTCRGRKYGVGNGGSYPEIASLSKLNTEPAIWFVDVAGTRLSMDTKELQNYGEFHRMCMEHADTCFKLVRQDVWLGMVSEAMQNMTLIDAPPDIGIAGMVLEQLETFLTNRQRGQKKEDILRGAPWEDEEQRRHYFRLSDFAKFLTREGMRDVKRGQLTLRIQKLGGGHKVFNIKNKTVNVWWVPSEKIAQEPELEVPEMTGEPI